MRERIIAWSTLSAGSCGAEGERRCAPEPAFGVTGVGSATLGCTTPGAPLGMTFLPAGAGGRTTGFVGFVGVCGAQAADSASGVRLVAQVGPRQPENPQPLLVWGKHGCQQSC